MTKKIEMPSNNWMMLFSDCIQEMTRHNVKIILKNSKSIEVPRENITTGGGYWDDLDIENPTFGCAIGHPTEQWLQTFAHEYCHYLQWLEQDKIWLDYRSVRSEDVEKIFNNKAIEKWKLDQALDCSKMLELDCEKRTVALLNKYKIPINIPEYIQKANVYIHFYNHSKQYRQWYPLNKSPFKITSLIKTASTNFYKNYDKIPEAMSKEYKKHYPPKKTNNIIK